VFARLHVEHELRDCPLEAGHLAPEEGEPRARYRRPGFEVEPERGADVGVFPGREGEIAPSAPVADLAVAGFVHTLRHVVGRQVG
jgi:hypothetical protein